MLATLVFALSLDAACPSAREQSPVERRDGSSVLRRQEAEAFAESVAEVIELVSEGAVFEAAPESLARLAVTGLFELRSRKVPADLARRLYETHPLSAEQLRRLLCEAHVLARPDGDLMALRDKVILRMVQAVDPCAEWTERGPFVDRAFFPCGVGLRLQPDPASGRMRVITPIRNSPADQAGIRAGDVLTEIVRIEDSKGEPVPVPEVIGTRGLSVAEVNARIGGKKGTRVRLSIRRGNDPVRTLHVRRDWAARETVVGWQLKGAEEWDYWLDPGRRIAYVRITAFSRETAGILEIVLDRLHKQGLRGLVLDLRFNPGGLLDASLRAADLLVDDGLLFRIRARNEESRFDGRHEGSRLDFPMACLINGESRRSAEVVAACLQDHKRAILIGERSGGRASIQSVLGCDKSERELRLTTAVFLRPGGHKLDRIRLKGHGDDEWGVTPDKGQTVPLSAAERQRLSEYLDSRDWVLRRDQPDELRHFRDRQREQALAYLRGRISGDSSKARQ